MKQFCILLALFVSGSVAATVGSTTWNSLVQLDVFPEELNTARSKSSDSSALLAELTGLLADDSVVNQVYDKWLSTFSPSHYDMLSSTVESRQEVFKNKMIALAEHNLEEAEGKHTWTVGLNQFSDLTSEEFKLLYTNSMPKNVSEAFTGIPQVTLDSISLGQSITPTNFRSTNKVSPIKNQGACGSCYSFATCGALESALLIKNGGANNTYDLSEQAVVACSDNNKCNGGFWPASFDYMKKGIVSEASYPYEQLRSTSVKACDKSGKEAKTKVAYVSSYTIIRPQTEAALQQALRNSGPLAVAVTTGGGRGTGGWQDYKSGIYSGANCGADKDIDHAVMLVDVESDSYVVKNSWDTTWGERGFIRLALNVGSLGACKIAEWACSVVPK